MPPFPGQEEAIKAVGEIVDWLIAHPDSGPFREPVDWQEFQSDGGDNGNDPKADEKNNDYLKAIGGKKNLMDLSTVKAKLERDEYYTASHCMSDIRRIWKNCIIFNESGSDFWLLAKLLYRRSEDRYRKVRRHFDVGFDKKIPAQSENSDMNDDINIDNDVVDSSEEVESGATSQAVGAIANIHTDTTSTTNDNIGKYHKERTEQSELQQPQETAQPRRSSKASRRLQQQPHHQAQQPPLQSGFSNPTTLDARARLASLLLLLDGPELGAIVDLLELDCPRALQVVCRNNEAEGIECGCSCCHDDDGDFVASEHVEINIDALDGRLLMQLTQFAAQSVERARDLTSSTTLPLDNNINSNATTNSSSNDIVENVDSTDVVSNTSNNGIHNIGKNSAIVAESPKKKRRR